MFYTTIGSLFMYVWDNNSLSIMLDVGYIPKYIGILKNIYIYLDLKSVEVTR